MTIQQMRAWLLEARPHWRKETVMSWPERQLIAVYLKERQKSAQKSPPRKVKQLQLF